MKRGSHEEGLLPEGAAALAPPWPALGERDAIGAKAPEPGTSAGLQCTMKRLSSLWIKVLTAHTQAFWVSSR